MTLFQDNPSPYITLVEQSSKPDAPASDRQLVYMKTDHKLYKENSGGTETEIGSGGGGGGAVPDYILMQDHEAHATAGGTFTSGAERVRDLNTVVSDDGGHVISLGSNQFTIEPGTYVIDAQIPGYGCDRHKAYLHNVTSGVHQSGVVGTNGFSSYVAGGYSHDYVRLCGKFTIAVQSVFEIHHICETTSTTYGFGVPSNFGSDIEVYTSVQLWKVG